MDHSERFAKKRAEAHAKQDQADKPWQAGLRAFADACARRQIVYEVTKKDIANLKRLCALYYNDKDTIRGLIAAAFRNPKIGFPFDKYDLTTLYTHHQAVNARHVKEMRERTKEKDFQKTFGEAPPQHVAGLSLMELFEHAQKETRDGRKEKEDKDSLA